MHKASPALVSAGDGFNTTFRATYAGEAGQRNNFRGPGYFGIDGGLAKSWNFNESKMLKFSWEVFNVTNSVRFDAAGSLGNQDLVDITGFGKFNQELTSPRVMQFALTLRVLTKVKVRIRISSKRKEDGTSRPFFLAVAPASRGRLAHAAWSRREARDPIENVVLKAEARKGRVRRYASGESLMRNRVRTCSEINSIAVRFLIGSSWARYFIASTSRRWPST